MTATTQAQAVRTLWTVDRGESSVDFAVKTFWGLMTVRGTFDRFEGSYSVGPDGAQIELEIEADSLDTGNSKRDEHLRSSDFFHVDAHPQVRFSSTRVHDVGDGILHVVGRLEAAGRSEVLEFPAEVRSVGDGIEMEATTRVDHTLLGMSSGHLGMIRPPATLHVKARLTETRVAGANAA